MPLKRALLETTLAGAHYGGRLSLPDEEARHLLSVLRAREGEMIEVLDGEGRAARAELLFRGRGSADVRLIEPLPGDPPGAVTPLTLEMAVLKSEAMGWVVEKAVELGARELVPVLTDHAVVQLDRKGPEAFQERWQKQADQALKQCGRRERLRVAAPVDLRLRLAETRGQGATRFWADEAARLAAPAAPITDAPPWTVLIGPEGGWSDAERQLLRAESVRPLALGPLVLRAETAAIAALALLSAELRGRFGPDIDKMRQVL